MAVLAVVGAIAFMGGSAGAKTQNPLTAPTGVRVTPGVGAVTVSWNPEADRPVIYSVISSPAGLACSVRDKTSCSMSDLVSTPYSFTVTASSKKLGTSPSSPPTPALDPHLVLVVAGQSNATGAESFAVDPVTGINYMAPPYTNGADANDLITWEPWWVLQGVAATPAPLDSPQQVYFPPYALFTIFGPEIGLARQIWADTGRSVTIVKATYPGSTLSLNWLPSQTGTPPDGSFPAMVSDVEGVMAADAAEGQFDVLGGFYWYEGEGAAGIPSLANAYQKNLKKFIVGLRKDLPMAATAPVVLAKEDITETIDYSESQGRITPAYAAIALTGNTEVRAADDWAAANLAGVVEVDTAGLPRNAELGGGYGHLMNTGELTLGEEMATISEPLLP